jgi:DNA-binding beta-propeller fold protein YncE
LRWSVPRRKRQLTPKVRLPKVKREPQGISTELGTCSGSGEVFVFDLRQLMPVALIPVAGSPGALAVSPDGRYVYVANDTTVTVIGH